MIDTTNTTPATAKPEPAVTRLPTRTAKGAKSVQRAKATSPATKPAAPKPAPAGAAKPAATPAATTGKAVADKEKWPWPDLPSQAKIKLLKSECPRQPGSKAAKHWNEKYRDGMTVEQFKNGGGEVGRLRTDLRRKNLSLETPK
jgi:hypothetical protein